MASNTQAIRAAIETLANTTAATAGPSNAAIQIAFNDVKFKPPSGAIWAKATIQWGEGVTWTGGAGVTGNRVTGLLSLSIFGPAGAGDGDLYTVADAFRAAFSRWKDAGTDTQFLAPSGPRPVPGGDEEEWAQVVVTIPFTVKES